MNASNPTIRPMEHRDAEEVALLCEELGYPATTAQIESRLENIRQSPPAQPAEIFVACDASTESVVGWVHVCMPTFLANGREAAIWGIVVASTRRGHGVGRAMMMAAESWAAHRGCDEMYLHTAAHREQAHAFYQRLGYQVIKSQILFSRSLSELPVTGIQSSR